MPQFRFDPEDFSNAQDLLSQRNASLPDERTVALVASAINTERRSRIGGDVTDEELRTAHDHLGNNEMRHRGGLRSVLESLASAMLARGLVPDTAVTPQTSNNSLTRWRGLAGNYQSPTTPTMTPKMVPTCSGNCSGPA